MTSRSRYADVSFGRIEYGRAGRSGPAVVLVHGFPSTWREWGPVMARLAPTHRVFAPNLPGIGGSSRSARGYAKTQLAADLVEFLDAIGERRVILVGHDIGSMVSHALARLHPERVERLVLVDAPLPGFEPWLRIKHDLRTWHFQFHAEPDLPELLVTGHVRAYVKRFYRRLVSNVAALDDHVIDVAARGYRSPSQLRSGFDFYRGFAQDERDAVELAQRPLPMPVLYIAGEVGAGPFVRFFGLGLAATGASDIRVCTVAGSGHWVILEQPERFSDLVRAFAAGETVGEVPAASPG